MVEPFLVGALIWLAKEVGSRGIGMIFDEFDGPAPVLEQQGAGLPPIKRYDLSGGARLTSDADVTVQYVASLTMTRLPVVLTFQDADGSGKGEPFPMVLTDTAHVTLRRGHYLITALVLRLPTESGVKPTLRAIGWQRPWIAGNSAEQLKITTSAPTAKLVKELGLVGSDGKPLFTLPPKNPPRALPSGSLGAGGTGGAARARVTPLRSESLRRALADRPSRQSPPPLGSREKCKAKARSGQHVQRCVFTATAGGLCLMHNSQLRSGRAVYWFDTGLRIRRTE